MAKGFQPRKSLTALAMEEPKAQILSECLQVAVSMEIVKVWREIQEGASLEMLIQWEQQHNVLEEPEAAFFIIGMPNQWQGQTGTYRRASKPGMGANVFSRLARHLAVMSFVAEGIEFLGVKYRADEMNYWGIGGDLTP